MKTKYVLVMNKNTMSMIHFCALIIVKSLIREDFQCLWLANIRTRKSLEMRTWLKLNSSILEET